MPDARGYVTEEQLKEAYNNSSIMLLDNTANTVTSGSAQGEFNASWYIQWDSQGFTGIEGWFFMNTDFSTMGDLAQYFKNNPAVAYFLGTNLVGQDLAYLNKGCVEIS